MRRNKKGFTLGEVLVCLMIIGVIMALSVNSIKIVRASYTSLTYFAFNNVQSMVGVIFAGSSPIEVLKDKDGNNLPSAVGQCRRDDGTVIQVLKSDVEYGNDIGIPNCSDRASASGNEQNLFCKSMVSIANTAGKTDCDNLSSVDYDTEPYIADLDYNNPNFIATNGQRYYISEWTYNENVSTDYGYRLIAVDLNGKSGPNKSDADSSVQPQDIVTFLVLDNGEVFPLGVAADNKKAGERTFMYLNSKIKGYYYTYDPDRYNDPDRKQYIPAECTSKSSNSSESIHTCNYAVVYVQNSKGTSFFSYREAYCKSLGDKVNAYAEYCNDITPSEYCPPSTNEQVFDLCLIHNVKPVFRFNFR